MEIFCGFHVFEYALWQEMKIQKCWKSTKGILNYKTLIVNNSYHYQETVENLPIWYLCTSLASRTRETPFKLHYHVDLDNFDQYFKTCAINTQNDSKSAVNNSVNNVKNQRTIIFCVFQVFKYAAHAFLYKQHFYKKQQAEIGKINKQRLSNTLRLNFCYLRIICFFHACYHPKIIGHILKNVQKRKCIYLSILMRLYD